ncbi:N-acetyltransferase 9-like protein isoform X2 [Macadamia integrifolia]|uniref:N-acetyltransferase 9-like protein isoform X2 n=1 Tax=Macadamia integrifolia TaxID=60698 RepID=UPI001C4E8C5F|nr:N-acetyltransferase 9-like protein isoform X2 [Macadamia integrifolia]
MSLGLEGKNVILVPYMREHAPKYHEWMQEPSMLQAYGFGATNIGPRTFVVLDKQLVVGDFFHGDPPVEAMVGDVNIYMIDLEDTQLAEIEIMIAEPKSHGKGLGEESILMVMTFAVENFGIHIFRVKMGESNTASLNLFRKLQVTLEWPVRKPKAEELQNLYGNLIVHSQQSTPELRQIISFYFYLSSTYYHHWFGLPLFTLKL